MLFLLRQALLFEDQNIHPVFPLHVQRRDLINLEYADIYRESAAEKMILFMYMVAAVTVRLFGFLTS